jgi:DNA-binding transcriptional ArsR family regulator
MAASSPATTAGSKTTFCVGTPTASRSLRSHSRWTRTSDCAVSECRTENRWCLASGELSSGEVVEGIALEFGISQPAVSQHLRVLRDNGFASVRPDGARRLYSVEAESLRAADVWLERFCHMWDQPLDAIDTETARGKRARRQRKK